MVANAVGDVFSKYLFGVNPLDVFYIWLIVYIFITFTFYLSTTLFQRIVWQRKTIEGANRVLLVTAHPDDECMFFGPTILRFLKDELTQFYVLCLSEGDFDGKGKERQAELWQSCTTLGIPSANITLLKFDYLRDDPAFPWPIEVIRRVVLSHVCSHQIDTIVTFDEDGVSGHLNHNACYKAIESLVVGRLLPPYCKAFALDTVNMFRKYVLGLLDIPLCYLCNRYIYAADSNRRNLIQKAMQCHKSQYVWYRKLYVMFSRYLTINTLSPILDEGQRDTVNDYSRKTK